MKTGKQIAASKMRKEAQNINSESIKDWIRHSIDKMIEIKDAESEIKT